MRTFWKRLLSTFSRPPIEAGLDDELRLHLELQVEENLRQGMPPDQARREALVAFGGIEQVKEKYRDRLTFGPLETLLQDFRFAWRMLCRSPGFAAVAVLTLALGIGANTTVFSVINAVLLRPLPFPEPDRLMVVLSTSSDAAQQYSSAEGVYLDWRERSHTFQSIAGADAREGTFIGPRETRHVRVARASFDLLTVLGVTPLLGRAFTLQDSGPDHSTAALLGEDFWHREFAGDRTVLGRTITLASGAYQVVGVLPSRFRFANLGAVDVWIPFHPRREARTGGPVIAVGRLRGGVTPAAAQAEMDSITQLIRQQHPEDGGLYVAVKPLANWMVATVRQPFLMLWGAVLFVLLICCANIANLLLARAAARQREMAMRSALGAGRWRLMRQTLVEGVLLAGLGGSLGLLLALAAVHAVPAIHMIAIPRVEEISLDRTMLAVAAFLSALSAALFGLPPALHVFRRNLNAALQKGDALGRVSGHRLRSFLVSAQLALALVLLSGAGLMTNGLLRLLSIDLGFDRSRVLTVSTEMPFAGNDRNRTYQLEQQLAAEVGRIPGVEKLTIVENPPLDNVHFLYYLESTIDGVFRQCQPEGRHVGAGYLGVTGIRLLAGRDFEPGDEARKPVPVLINAATARALFGGLDPIGRSVVSRHYLNRPVLQIVGVVGDARQLELTGPPGPQIYVPAIYGYGRRLMVRVARGARDVRGPIRAAVHSLFGAVPAPDIESLDDRLFEEVAKPRFYMMLLGAFAIAGVMLAAIGIYGVMSYNVARRTREIGIRIALGAEPRTIRRMVLASGLRTTLAGVALGVAGAWAATPLLSSLLYGVKPNDPLTFACVVTLLVAVAMLACYLAAAKATTVDPTEALRCE
jgi:predicted permease